jgi:uncharacterized protein (AIM24 family)
VHIDVSCGPAYAAAVCRLAGGESVFVERSSMAVAWSADMKMKSGPLGGPLKAVLTGELWVGEFHGPRHVLTQTRAPAHLRGWLLPERTNVHV